MNSSLDINDPNELPLQLSEDSTLKNPYQVTLPGGYFSHTNLEGIQEKPSFIEGAKAQAYNVNSTLRGANALSESLDQMSDPLFDLKPDGWDPKADLDKFPNIRPQYISAMLEAKSPRHQQYVARKIYQEQKLDDDVANGSWMSWLLGGAVGIVSDPMTYIPIAGWVKYGKISSSFVQSAARSIPGGATYGVLSSASEQLDKVNGNLHDFMIDSFTRTAFSTVLFGSLGAGATLSEKMELWNLRKFANAEVDGVTFKLKTNEKGKIEGFETVNTGGLSAQRLSFYEDMAKSSFNKSGVFKIPYVGEGIIKLAGMPVFGSPLINLINSKSQVVRSFIDRVADHNFVTTGVAEGEVAPRKFTSLMNQEFAQLRSNQVQYDALFYERNGIDTKNRIIASAVDNVSYLKNKGMEALGKSIDKDSYVSREAFNSEVQEVLTSTIPSQHSSVNQAANMQRELMDKTYKNYRKAYNLPDDWLPPKTAEGFLTRVYDTPYMNLNKNSWTETISNYLRDSDVLIQRTMEPINKLKTKIKEFEDAHTQAFSELGISELQLHPSRDISYPEEQGVTIRNYIAEIPKRSKKNRGNADRNTPLIPHKDIFEVYKSMKSNLKSLEESLQNELRNNPEYQLLVEDWSALSSDEGKELSTLLNPVKNAEKEIEKQKKIIYELKPKNKNELVSAKKSKTVEEAKPKSKKYIESQERIKQEEDKLFILEQKLDEEKQNLQELAYSGKINPRFYRKHPDSPVFVFKNPNERLKLRKTYHEREGQILSEAEAHKYREEHATAYYNTILNQTPEDTINQTMGFFTGNPSESTLKSRTLLVPDKILYNGKFLTNDVMAKVSNYVSYLARRTHLKTVFNDVSVDGGIEPLLHELGSEFQRLHVELSNRKTELETKLQNKDLSISDKNKYNKELKKIDKSLVKERKQFDKNKQVIGHIYEKMMGIQKTSRRAQQVKSAVMSITAWTNLPFVPLTQINDLSAIGLQHGIIPFIRDGLYPLVTSLGGILKTKDSEALRKAAPSIHLALQDINMGYADRNWGMATNPYLNLGRTVQTLEKIAHLSSNFTMTNYIDNMMQRVTGSVVQSELMRILHSYKKGSMSARDGNYIRKYGIDPKIWADRIIDAYKKNGGGKTKLGGYQSHFWQWEDQQASNIFGDAIFRSIKDTQINAGLIDAPLFLDDNGPIGVMGSFLRGFNGWAFASVNRYVIPSLQQADAEKFIGVLAMLGTGFLVDPMRRIARGEDPMPDTLTPKEIAWSTINNSGYFSWFANVLSNANLLTGDSLLGNLRSDKFKDRTRSGLLGPAWGTVNRMADIFTALASGEMNESDAKKMARMIPFANASWTYWMSKHLIESLELPKTRAEAHALSGD